jgi:hypothetical protein
MCWIDIKIKGREGLMGVDAKELIDLIQSEIGAEKHIHFDGKWHVTNEWICGSFAGRSFSADTIEGSAEKLIDYFNNHIGHNSIVGNEVTQSGWPDLKKVKKYLTVRVNEGGE